MGVRATGGGEQRCGGVAKAKIMWPAWASWALVGVVATSILTIFATFRDIF
jgi:hypothetical protein